MNGFLRGNLRCGIDSSCLKCRLLQEVVGLCLSWKPLETQLIQWSSSGTLTERMLYLCAGGRGGLYKQPHFSKNVLLQPTLCYWIASSFLLCAFWISFAGGRGDTCQGVSLVSSDELAELHGSLRSFSDVGHAP